MIDATSTIMSTSTSTSYLLPLFFPTPTTLHRQGDDHYPTSTSEHQLDVEQRCQACIDAYIASVQKQDAEVSDAEQRGEVSDASDMDDSQPAAAARSSAASPTLTPVTNLATSIHAQPLLNRSAHIDYLLQGLHQLPSYYTSLDASRPWILYWIVHSLRLLDYEIDEQTAVDAVQWLALCQNSDGGFGGGPGQISHTAPTYATVCAVYELAAVVKSTDKQAQLYNMINRQAMYTWLMSLRSTQTTPYRRKSSKQIAAVGFAVHTDGEVDSRGTYCAIAIATMLNIVTPQLTEGVAEYVASCQTYEGGIGGESGVEAHGGYAYCGLATMILLKQTHMLDLKSLLRWAVHRQLSVEGGFNGRTNKLVDGCYSFWVGALLPLLQYTQHTADHSTTTPTQKLLLLTMPTFHPLQLQKYLLICCADPPTVNPHARGGLRDKPGKGADYYHTCYCLSGLSVAQHCALDASSNAPQLLTHEADRLHPTNVLFNVTIEAAAAGEQYYAQQAAVH